MLLCIYLWKECQCLVPQCVDLTGGQDTHYIWWTPAQSKLLTPTYNNIIPGTQCNNSYHRDTVRTEWDIKFYVTPCNIIAGKLHWQPFNDCIIFKILLLTFKLLHNIGSMYLKTLLELCDPQRNLRSTTDPLMPNIPKSKLKNYRNKAFSVVAPTKRQKLPVNIRSWKSVTHFIIHVLPFPFQNLPVLNFNINFSSVWKIASRFPLQWGFPFDQPRTYKVFFN